MRNDLLPIGFVIHNEDQYNSIKRSERNGVLCHLIMQERFCDALIAAVKNGNIGYIIT